MSILDGVAAQLRQVAEELASVRVALAAANAEMDKAKAQFLAVGYVGALPVAMQIQRGIEDLLTTVAEASRQGTEITAGVQALIGGPAPANAPGSKPVVIDFRPYLNEDRRRHILDGEPDGRGGHRSGLGRVGKTEFPASWSDRTVVEVVLDVARRPDQVEQKRKARRVSGRRDGVDVVVVIRNDGSIRTAYPRPGGRGVVDNREQES